MKVAIRGGKIQRGGSERAGEDGAALPRRDAAEPAFPDALQPGRGTWAELWEGRDRQTGQDGQRAGTDKHLQGEQG